ncbi:hypothetical protein GS397_22945 [Sphingobium yanoikuyae]|uniref:Uncharacterized protein n=1 Tax=Sphingobium yanoikuyae TaxID=13690 RepID=A0A6P1GMZ4_SPHYA|nr:hypothetical protein [Sphingobium yanoikuyae]QHD69614.1 hypothetical protein GS397_22945 [Sphingobium yanoikuyae]
MLELFDLHALIQCHADDPDLCELAMRVRSAVSAVSVRSDLKRAMEMMSACKALSRMAQTASSEQAIDREGAATIQALFTQALVLYCRATHSGSKGRHKLQITNHLNPELRIIHDRVTDLRDRYLMHFEDSSGWEEHRAVLALDIEAGMMALSYPHASAYIRQGDAEDFERLLVFGYNISNREQAAMSKRVNEELNSLFERRPDFLEMLRATPFSPESFFDPDEIADYLAGIGRREADPHTDPRIGVMQARANNQPEKRKKRR